MRWSQQAIEGIRKLEQQGLVKDTTPFVGAAPMPDIDTEKAFQAAVEKEARKRGWLCYHTRDSRKSAAGFPDLVMLRNGYMIVAELKVGNNKLEATQETWRDEFVELADQCKRNVGYYVWYPEQWQHIINALTDLGMPAA